MVNFIPNSKMAIPEQIFAVSAWMLAIGIVLMFLQLFMTWMGVGNNPREMYGKRYLYIFASIAVIGLLMMIGIVAYRLSG